MSGECLLQAQEVQRRIVHADAPPDEGVVEPVERAMKPRDERAGRARLGRPAHDVERDALDVGQHAPDRALDHHEGLAGLGRDQRGRDQPGIAEPLRDRDDVLVNRRREDGVHPLQHRARAVGTREQIGLVDETVAERRDLGPDPRGILGQNVRVDLDPVGVG